MWMIWAGVGFAVVLGLVNALSIAGWVVCYMDRKPGKVVACVVIYVVALIMLFVCGLVTGINFADSYP